MGWLVSMDPTKDRKRLVEEILDDYRRPRRRQHPTLVDHSLRGNTLYMVVHIPAWRANGVRPAIARPERLANLEFDLRGNYRVILVYLLAGSRNPDEGWGYKDMDESMGPKVADCPERLLKQSQVDDRHGWREDCRRVRREKNARKKWVKSLQPGAKLELFRGYYRNEATNKQELWYDAVVFDRPFSATFFVGHFAGDNRQYKMRWEHVKPLSSDEEAA